MAYSAAGVVEDGVVREGPRGQARDEEKGIFSCGGSGRCGSSDSSRGSGRLGGRGGLRCQTGDEEELVGSSGGRRPPTGVGVATNCYDERNERRHERK